MYIMLKLILFNVIFICSVSSYVIELVASSKFVRLKDDAPPPSLFTGDKIAFKVNVYDSGLKPTKIWCTHNGNFVLQVNCYKKGLYYISQENKNSTDTMIMDGIWNCRAFFHNDSPRNFDLKVNVKSLPKIPSGNEGSTKIINTNAGISYINCSMYISQGKLVHVTDVLMYRNQPYTIYVAVEPGVIKRGHPTWIQCFKDGRSSQIFVNEPLTKVKAKHGHYYKTHAHSAVDTMEGSWKCLISSDLNSNAPLSLTFNVKFKEIPVFAPGQPNVNIDRNEDNRAQSPVGIETQQNEKVAINKQIVIRFFNNDQGQNSIETKVPLLLLGQNLSIAVEDRENTNQFTKIMCHFIANPRHIFIDSILTQEQTHRFVSKVIKLDKKMSAKWKCLVYNYFDQTKVIDFDVGINTGTVYMHVFVNEQRMNVTNNLVNGMYYDAKLEYNFYDGELAKIRCELINGINIEAKLIAQNGTQVFKTQPHSTNPETMYIKLTRDYHASYIDCTVTNTFPRTQTNTVRLLFFMQRRTIDFDKPIFKVNHLPLVPNINNEYFYDYYSGETLDISGYTDPINSWDCNSKPEDNQMQQLLKQTDGIYLTVTSDHKKMLPSIDCIVGNNIAVLLNLKLFNPFDPVINGLSMSQTLLSYQQSQNTYVMTYRNNGNSNLKLFCTSNYSGCKWSYEDHEVTAEIDAFNFIVNRNRYVSTINLSNYSVESTVIKCTCPQDAYYNIMHTFSVVINSQLTEEPTTIDAGRLHLDGAVEENLDLLGVIPLGGTAETTSAKAEPPLKPGGEPLLSKEIIIGIIVVTVLLIVILVIWLIVGSHKRRRKREQAQASDINYENLPEHHEGPMRMPAQWNQYTEPPTDETYTYCVPYEKNVEEMYAQPQPKNQRQPEPISSAYAEVGALEPTYAAVGHEASPTLYVNTKDDQMPAYSQIQPKNKRGNAGNAPQVLPKPVNQNYAQVLPKSVREGAQYDNVIKNQRYVNAETKEYAEPAYCEVAKKK